MKSPTLFIPGKAVHDAGVNKIAVYINRGAFLKNWWMRGEVKMLIRLLVNSLQNVDAVSELLNPAFHVVCEGEILIIVTVTDTFTALETVTDDLHGVDLLTQCQIAWLDPVSALWKTHYPAREARPFEQILVEATTEWMPRMEKSLRISEAAGRVLTELLKSWPPQPPPAPTP